MNAALALVLLAPAAPDPLSPIDTKACVAKGLTWLAEQQKDEGNWSGRADSLPATTTATAGLALLMEGSTLRTGTYAPNLRRAVAWVEKNAQPNGSLATTHPTESARPLAAHAHVLLFLTSAYDVDDDVTRRARLRQLLDRAVKYVSNAQTARGGWALSPPIDRTAADDPHTTVTTLHALCAARKAGVDVPKGVTDKATEYLDRYTTAAGAIVPRGLGDDPAFDGIQTPYTAGAATVALLSEGRRPAAFVQWLRNVQRAPIVAWPARPTSTTMLAHLNRARLTYALGEDGLRQFDPEAKDGSRLKWSAYRETVYRSLVATQAANGSWAETVPGPVYGSAIALVILQLENDHLPAFSR